MIKMIDEVLEEEVTGYGYNNKSGNLEKVEVHPADDDVLQITVDHDDVCIYKQDVPKLIKALTLAAKL